MKRIFSGAKSPEFPAPPKFFQRDGSSSGPSSPKGIRSRSSSISKIFSGDSSPKAAPVELPQEMSASGNVSPELVPIVTLLSAHTHRRYHEGVFLILQDLKADGSPAARKWQEVYGVLIGTQLALWDAKELADCDTGANPRLKDVAAKPHYINFTDASLRALNGSDAVVTESKKKLNNALVVSTTLKNRYFLQYSDKESFNRWHAAIRLSLFECTSLQEAYTGAFLSSRGAKLGDIKIILADSKFNYEDWVSVRFGTGMPWKRCFAVISQGTSKKHPYGKIKFYENEKKTKKAHVMATVVSSKALYAVYPSSPMLIDTSTIIKVEGEIIFDKKETPQETNIFIMPEKHQAVPGYDTIIRFLVPAMNAFKLYGRPKKLIANKDDQNSLLFALPTLPHVHYLKVDELLPLTNSVSSLQWTPHDWRDHVRDLLQKKISQGYTGCGSSSGLTGALASPVIGSAELFEGSGGISSPTFLSLQKPFYGNSLSSKSNLSGSISTITSRSGSPNSKRKSLLGASSGNKVSSDSVSATSFYSSRSNDKFETPHASGLQIHKEGVPPLNIAKKDVPSFQITEDHSDPHLKVDIPNSNFDRLGEDKVKKNKNDPVSKFSHASDLSAIYDKYSASPFGQSQANSPVAQTIEINDRSPYEQYVGSSEGKTFEIPNIRDSNSTADTTIQKSMGNYYAGNDDDKDDDLEEARALTEFNDLANRVRELEMKPNAVRTAVNNEEKSPIALDFNFSAANDEATGYGDEVADDDANVFDPDFMEQNQMLENESRHFAADSQSNFSGHSHSQEQLPQEDRLQQTVHVPAPNMNHNNQSLPHSAAVTDFRQHRKPPAGYHGAQAQGPMLPQNGYGNGYRQPPPQQAFDLNHAARRSPYQRQGYPNSSVRPSPQGISPQNPQFPNHGQGYKAPYATRPTHPQLQQQAPINMQQQHRPYSPKYAQKYPPQQHPNQGRPYNNVYNGSYAPQSVHNMEGVTPMQPQGRAGPYPQAPGPMGSHKPRVPPSSGFSQFMPTSTTNANPYSR